MKSTFPLLLSLLFSIQSWAQSLDGSMGATSLDQSMAPSKQLTDQQMNESKTFVHEGKKQQAYDQACKDQGGVCDGSSVNKGAVLPAALEDNIGKLYVLVFGGMGFISGGGGPKVTINSGDKAAPAKPAANEDATSAPADKAKGKDTAADYCLYAAIAGEGLATMMQGSQQKQASQEAANLNDPQLSALVQLKETHKARKRTATYQSAVFGATAACYAARKLLQPTVVMDTKYIIKMGAAAGISALYMKKADKHADAMKKIQKVIDSMPKAGDCNPWTGTSCFCKEASSSKLYPGQYQEVCMLNGGLADGPKANMGCGVMSGGIVQADPTCTCKQNNTCIKTMLKFANPNIGFGTNFLNAANAGYSLLDPSQFDEGKLKAYSIAASALNNKMKTNLPASDANLSPAQQKISDDLKEVVPPAIADMAAASSSSPSAADQAMNNSLSSSGLSKLPEPLKKALSNPEVSGGYRSNGGSTDSGGGEANPFVMPGMGGEQASQGGVETLTFAEKAVSNAEISNRPETPIFDIISNRYRSSGWTRLNK